MKTKTSIYASAILASLTLASAPVNAAAETLAQWDFSSNMAATTVASGITASAVSFGAFNGISSSGNTYARSSGGADLFARAFQVTSPYPQILGTDEAAAESRNTYFEFTLTPGVATDFGTMTATISAQIAKDVSNPANAFTANYFLVSNEDAYATILGTGSVSAPAQAINAGITVAGSFEADLSAFQDIDSAVTFRLYTYVTSAVGEDLNFSHISRVDNITVNSIPEPSQAAAAIGIISLMTIAGVRRRAKR